MTEIALTLCIPAPEPCPLTELVKHINFDRGARFTSASTPTAAILRPISWCAILALKRAVAKHGFAARARVNHRHRMTGLPPCFAVQAVTFPNEDFDAQSLLATP